MARKFLVDVVVPDEAYDATAWNGSLEVPTKNAIRDKIETMSGGDVAGPASATDNALVRFDSTTGKLIQNSNATLDDTGILTLDAGGEMHAPNYTAAGEGASFNAYGQDAASGTAGSAALYGGIGTAGNANGGDVYLGGGSGDGSGIDGLVKIQDAVSGYFASLDVSALTANRTVTFPDTDVNLGGSGVSESLAIAYAVAL